VRRTWLLHFLTEDSTGRKRAASTMIQHPTAARRTQRPSKRTRMHREGMHSRIFIIKGAYYSVSHDADAEGQIDSRNALLQLVVSRSIPSRLKLLIAEFYLVDRGLRHRLPGFSSLDRPVVLTQGLRRFRCQWSHCGSCPTGPDSRGAGLVRSELIPIGHVAY
jgi:hypothetical protein